MQLGEAAAPEAPGEGKGDSLLGTKNDLGCTWAVQQLLSREVQRMLRFSCTSCSLEDQESSSSGEMAGVPFVIYHHKPEPGQVARK